MSAAKIRIGLSGWRYAPWRGTFYPEDLPQRLELEHASKTFPVIELNGSFHALQKPTSYADWYARTPADFVFSVKGPRFITHIRKLKDVEQPLANFFASGLFNLSEKLGPIVWQLPPSFTYDPGLMLDFLERLPADFAAAAVLARKRDAFMKGRARLGFEQNHAMRHAIEVRNDSFLDATYIRLLRKFKVAAVIAESARGWPIIEDVTTDFVYLRLHGDKQLYRGGYSDKSLDEWGRRIECWGRGSEPPDARKVLGLKPPAKVPRDVFCFFDSPDVKLRAPFDAMTLTRKLGLSR